MQSFWEVAASIGCVVRSIVDDGEVHRCPTIERPRKRNGAYAMNGVTGWIRNWETGQTVIWHCDSPQEARRSPPRPFPSASDRHAELERRATQAAKLANQRIKSAAMAHHAYLESKGFPKQFGLVEGQLLLIPAYIGGKVSSLQEITAEGVKKNLPGGKMGGATCTIGSGRLEILCEGYATGLSIKAALAGLQVPGRVVCCFSASNIAVVAPGRSHALVFADHDRPIEQLGGLGTGEFYARKTGLPWAMPPGPGDANDLHKAEGLPALQAILLELTTRQRLRAGHALRAS